MKVTNSLAEMQRFGGVAIQTGQTRGTELNQIPLSVARLAVWNHPPDSELTLTLHALSFCLELRRHIRKAVKRQRGAGAPLWSRIVLPEIGWSVQENSGDNQGDTESGSSDSLVKVTISSGESMKYSIQPCSVAGCEGQVEL